MRLDFKFKMRILVIDDDPALTTLVYHVLSSQGYDVITAHSGEEGLQKIREANPDLVILDLMLPVQDGWNICKAIRAFSNVPIVVMSALNGAVYIASALDAGADDYLVKPVPNGMLIARINKLLRRTTGSLKQPPAQTTSWVTHKPVAP